MFTPGDRDRMFRLLVARAEEDPDITGAVLLGSSATGDTDRWSDLDIAFTVRGSAPVMEVVERWTGALSADPGVVHHWDLPVREGALVRVFLLTDGQELDLNFYPEGTLVRYGPAWRPVFGDFGGSEDWTPAVDDDARGQDIGLTWHHILHADTCLQRSRLWQAEHWIGQARGHIIALACRRLAFPTAYAKGAHFLPADVTDSLEPTLVRSLGAAEVRRALTATSEAFLRELRHQDSDLADRLKSLLAEDRRAGAA